jgi:hypothetical protein
MRRLASLATRALVGWAICGATVMTGRQLLPMTVALVVHAIAAPLAFAVLTWDHVKRFPTSSPSGTALIMVALVIGLDALVVAPFLERSYDMFRSPLGTWLPFALILVASYSAARVTREG